MKNKQNTFNTRLVATKPKQDDFTKRCLDGISFVEEAQGMTYKELSDHIIYNYPIGSQYKWGTLNCGVLDRVILILQDLHAKEKKEKS